MGRGIAAMWGLLVLSSATGCWLTADFDDLGENYRVAVLADHPVVYLRLDESVGPTAHDLMGHYDGAYPGAAIDFGVAGALAADPALGLNVGVDKFDLQGVAMPPGLDFAGKAPFTVELWASPTDFYGAGALVDHSNYAGNTNGWTLSWAVDGVMFIRWADGFSGSGGVASSALPLGIYRHIVVVFDGAQLRLYVDGALQQTNASDYGLITTGGWTTGKQNCSPCTQNGFGGSIDELAVYDYDLAEARVKAHYQAGRPQ